MLTPHQKLTVLEISVSWVFQMLRMCDFDDSYGSSMSPNWRCIKKEIKVGALQTLKTSDIVDQAEVEQVLSEVIANYQEILAVTDNDESEWEEKLCEVFVQVSTVFHIFEVDKILQPTKQTQETVTKDTCSDSNSMTRAVQEPLIYNKYLGIPTHICSEGAGCDLDDLVQEATNDALQNAGDLASDTLSCQGLA